MAGVRVITGTIPDYATEVKGLLLGGVIGGGPAEQAGLQKGDVIVEIAGQTIANIYDYTYALELLKVDQPVKVVYMRGRTDARDDADARRRDGKLEARAQGPARLRPDLGRPTALRPGPEPCGLFAFAVVSEPPRPPACSAFRQRSDLLGAGPAASRRRTPRRR